MLDMTNTSHRPVWDLADRVRMLFLCLPWMIVAYGAGLLIDHVAFYRNSVKADAIVVDIAASPEPVNANRSRLVGTLLAEEASPWYVPGFLYTHENGAAYVGSVFTHNLPSGLLPGETVAIRYHRGRPHQAQPVTLFGFWLEPGRYILTGVFLFLILSSVFRIVDRHARADGSENRKPTPKGVEWVGGRLNFTA